MSQLDEYRKRLDAIDGGLVELFLRRNEITGKIGEYKRAAGMPVLDAGRERQVIDSRTALAATPAERLYTARQSTQISGQTGSIGHLRADMGGDGKGFSPSGTVTGRTWTPRNFSRS